MEIILSHIYFFKKYVTSGASSVCVMKISAYELRAWSLSLLCVICAQKKHLPWDSKQQFLPKPPEVRWNCTPQQF